MIHPDTNLQFINDEIGFGVFATKKIPEGTIVYVEDGLEQIVSPLDFDRYPPVIQQNIEKYSFIDRNGNRIVSWDHAKYVNHSCSFNTISTGYGFEIAVTDIRPGEQITDEYGLFNLNREMICRCGSDNCRTIIRPDDTDRYYEEWDEKIRTSLAKLTEVEQPLREVLDENVWNQLNEYFKNSEKYKSVRTLKYEKTIPASHTESI